ncbi:MAG: DegT/DnrJ/EryC1/StrS family aminotransferase [Bacteroidales bacterium]|nr:DegT/DnrJ/EryC1/StrS family aminotransferase [Bacteroidales bacterium]
MIPFLSLKDITARYADEIHEAVRRVVDSGWYLQGEENARFEQHYAEYVGTKHCVGCANGLDALIWIYRAYVELGMMKPGDEVIVPANTYIASVLAITENGLKAVLVEPNPETLELDDTLVEDAITERTRSVLLVHLYGRCAYTEKVGELCRKYHLHLVEDNAQAHGCMYGNKRTGSIGEAAGHSFYPGKNLGALGDGGAVTTDNEALADTIRTLANYGSQKKYVFKYCGRNSRLDEIQAAVLDVKLRHLDEDNRLRQQVAAYYYNHITNPLIKLPVRLPDANNVYHLFPILCERRDELQQYLKGRGVQTLIHYPIPPHMQECYAGVWQGLQLPITERLARQELSLPISPFLSSKWMEKVVVDVNYFMASPSQLGLR